FPFLLFSQKPETLKPSNPKTSKPYFQQEVNYTIAVALDDKTHTLSGTIEFEYINHSPDALPEIWMHLWGNAFKNRQTAFCKQKLRDGSSGFYFADEKNLGYFKNLDFSANGQKIEWKYDAENPDIALLKLAQPLPPGGRIRIATPFVLKIPASFSRLGHVGTSYQMTQWFPKPAVYDNRGWHQMPYLDMGEFYSEFGSFDVTITLPDNYVVGATGVLQTPAEIEFLARKEAESREIIKKMVNEKIHPYNDSFPASSPVTKTIRYTAERVHDFAWFADKRFLVAKDTAHLASGKTVDCWAMFPPSKRKNLKSSQGELWAKGAFYVRRAVEFYSEKVGEYPYPHATAVHSALSAGAGMEYPMITVIGNSSSAEDLDDVITHEVGHNWFYGILASNERDHPFMDEGLNSYYEQRYMLRYYETYDPVDLPKFLYNPERNGPLLNSGYLLLAREHTDTPPDTHSNDFAPLAYGLEVYMKTALCMDWLEKSVGTARLDTAMQDFYRQWQFRHPYPEDLKAVFEKNKIDAGWFFETMQTQKHADFALNGIKKDDGHWTLDVENKGDLNAPFSVTALKDGEAVDSKWFSMPGELDFPATDANAFIIDHEYNTLDLNRKNNQRRAEGFLPAFEPLEITSLAPFQNPNRSTIAVLPWLGWNNYDKTMLGAVIYNPPLPLRRLQYYLAPGYGLGSKQFVGLADVRYCFFPGGMFPKVTLGVGAKTFDFDYNWQDDYYSKFYRIAPQIRAELRDNSVSFRHFLNFRTLFIGKENDLRDSTGAFAGKEYDKYTIYEVRYEAEQRKLPNPWHLTTALEWQNGIDAFGNEGKYLRGSLEWKQQFYFAPKRKISLRAFAGSFLMNDRRNDGIVAGDPAQASFALNPQGFNDYRYDQVFFARSGGGDILGRQMSQTEGGFKGAFGSEFAGTIGVSNNYILSLNLKADLPQRLPLGIPLKPWFDIGWFDDATQLGEDRPSSEQLLWSGGFMLEFFNGGLEVYFPVVHSKPLKAKYDEVFGGNYWKWISWSVRLNMASPTEILD
ncbi:MAG TPA: M1 family metallopeptidase, partial [Saprospiraceae bacterium]|nr:M1 family metallopeptidase [Saprospiraceae bacterium]